MLQVQYNKKPIAATCTRCGYDWTYKGKNPFFTTCPFCRTSVKLTKTPMARVFAGKRAIVETTNQTGGVYTKQAGGV